MKISVFGGTGYLGHILVPMLLDKGYEVNVIDTQWYGNKLKSHRNLKIYKENILFLKNKDDVFLNNIFNDCYIVLLAGVSLEITEGIDADFTKAMNLTLPKEVIRLANEYNSKRIIFASSAGVYGNKSLRNVREDHVTEPSNLYSIYKLEIEKHLFNNKYNSIECCATRSCTIVGYSPLFRIDLVVNRFAVDAFYKKKIKVFGGEQLRSCIHIQDSARFYCHLIEADSNIINMQSYNIVASQFSILELSNIVKDYFKCEVEVFPESTDDRSYHILAEKALHELNFKPKRDISDSLDELKKYLHDGKIDEEHFSYLEETKKIITSNSILY